jgi:hypothetical protein
MITIRAGSSRHCSCVAAFVVDMLAQGPGRMCQHLPRTCKDDCFDAILVFGLRQSQSLSFAVMRPQLDELLLQVTFSKDCSQSSA